jgi:hypothetical protein
MSAMLWDKKKVLSSLIAKRKPDGERSMEPTPMQIQEVKDEDGELDGRHVASQEALHAIHTKDPMKFMEAMKNFIDLHGASESKEPEPEEG